MSGTLVIGLGNPLAGDDGVGWYAAECLRRDPRLPENVTVIQGGTDLLHFRHLLPAHDRVFIIDAILDPGPAGRLLRFDDLDLLDQNARSVHHTSPAHALRLLRCVHPEIAAIPVTVLCVAVHSVALATALSDELTAQIPRLLDAILAALPPKNPTSGMR